MSIITASTWVPRGIPAAIPAKYNFDENELARISKLAHLQLEDARLELDHVKDVGHRATDSEDSTTDGETRISKLQSPGYVEHSHIMV